MIGVLAASARNNLKVKNARQPVALNWKKLESVDVGSMNVGPGFSSTSFAMDVNIVAYHLHKPNHHLIPELVISNNVF